MLEVSIRWSSGPTVYITDNEEVIRGWREEGWMTERKAARNKSASLFSALNSWVSQSHPVQRAEKVQLLAPAIVSH